MSGTLQEEDGNKSEGVEQSWQGGEGGSSLLCSRILQMPQTLAKCSPAQFCLGMRTESGLRWGPIKTDPRSAAA